MLAYAIGMLIGEEVRDQVYGLPVQQGEQVAEEERIPGQPQRKQGKTAAEEAGEEMGAIFGAVHPAKAGAALRGQLVGSRG